MQRPTFLQASVDRFAPRASRFFHRHEYVLLWITAISFATVTFLLLPQSQVLLVDTYENVAYAIDPSPERAFAYGERHLDARAHPEFYDIGRAEHFFSLIVHVDPAFPYLYHELARIAFLHGDYPEALLLINEQIRQHGGLQPQAYYIRGLIEGYMQQYDAAAKDYAQYLRFDPHDWAAINDYAWVLLQAHRFQDAADATAAGLAYFPDNPWLLNTNAIALYELGALGPARQRALSAIEAAMRVTETDWLRAYPGNDPKIAPEGIAVFQHAIIRNMHTILLASASSTIQ